MLLFIYLFYRYSSTLRLPWATSRQLPFGILWRRSQKLKYIQCLLMVDCFWMVEGVPHQNKGAICVILKYNFIISYFESKHTSCLCLAGSAVTQLPGHLTKRCLVPVCVSISGFRHFFFTWVPLYIFNSGVSYLFLSSLANSLRDVEVGTAGLTGSEQAPWWSALLCLHLLICLNFPRTLEISSHAAWEWN